MFRDIWMLSRPKTNQMWYNKLSKSQRDNDLLDNLDLDTDGKGLKSGSKCLVMKKYTQLNPKILLAVEACNEKHSAICRTDPRTANSVEEAPKFPCLTSNRANRRKRASPTQNDSETGNDKGLFLHHTRYCTHIQEIYTQYVF